MNRRGFLKATAGALSATVGALVLRGGSRTLEVAAESQDDEMGRLLRRRAELDVRYARTLADREEADARYRDAVTGRLTMYGASSITGMRSLFDHPSKWTLPYEGDFAVTSPEGFFANGFDVVPGLLVNDYDPVRQTVDGVPLAQIEESGYPLHREVLIAGMGDGYWRKKPGRLFIGRRIEE